MAENCLVHRLAGYPMVGEARKAMEAGLETAKGQGYGLGKAAVWAEWAAGKGLGVGQQLAETGPAKHISKAIADRLPTVEAALPILTMTPEQLKTAYYQGTKLAGLLNVAGDWANAGKQKMVNVGDETAQKTGQLLHSTVDVLHGLLDRTEDFCDHYLAPGVSKSEHDYAKSEGGLTARASNILAKTAAALKGRIPEMPRLSDIPTVNLAELNKAKAGAVESLGALGHTLKDRASAAGTAVIVAPENALVGLVKLAVSLSAAFTAKSLAYTPRPLYQTGQTTAAYLEGLEGRLAGQARVGDVARTAWDEAKTGKAALDASLLRLLDLIGDSAPFSWIKVQMDGVDFGSQDLLNMNRSQRYY